MPDKPIARIDSLIATAKGGQIIIQARGAVTGGGWKRVALKPIKPSLPGRRSHHRAGIRGPAAAVE